ncbi:MAG: hypothetical protein IPL10_12445 [Bacteroidetes bacterium]|nr:hypothetical protein [Bacteroidota bacterium]
MMMPVVLRFNKNGVRQFATYYGSNGDDHAGSGVLDTLGNYYITGTTTALIPFPAVQPSGAFVDNTANGNVDMFIAKFDTAGKVLWATLYGGSGDDYANKIRMDHNGNIVIIGYHNIGTFSCISKTGAYNSTKGRGFVMKFTSTLQRDWITKYGNKVTSPTWGEPFCS